MCLLLFTLNLTDKNNKDAKDLNVCRDRNRLQTIMTILLFGWSLKMFKLPTVQVFTNEM